MSRIEILTAGHGGQGVLLLGDYIAYAAMLDGKRVAYTPSYGPETRGGKAKSYVVISDEEIDTPIVERPDVLLVMNQPSMDFVTSLKPGGTLVYNGSLIEPENLRNDIQVVEVPATEVADAMKNELAGEETDAINDTKLFSNAVMFGAYLARVQPHISNQIVNETLKHFLSGGKEKLIPLNAAAIEKGRRESKILMREAVHARALA